VKREAEENWGAADPSPLIANLVERHRSQKIEIVCKVALREFNYFFCYEPSRGVVNGFHQTQLIANVIKRERHRVDRLRIKRISSQK
jgi:hypothetical protein